MEPQTFVEALPGEIPSVAVHQLYGSRGNRLVWGAQEALVNLFACVGF